MSDVDARRQVVRQGLAIGLATGMYGTSFGAVGVASGLSILQTCALSLLVFTGASQFAFIGVIAAGGSPWAGTATGLLLGSRNTLYGLGLAPRLRLRGMRRLGAAQLVIDESSAVGTQSDDPALARLGFGVTGVAVFVLWNLMTLVGAVLGEALGDPRTYGLDAAVGAAFLALLWPRLSDPSAALTAVGGAIVALALVPFAPAGVPVLAAAGVALIAAALPQAPRRPQPSEAEA